VAPQAFARIKLDPAGKLFIDDVLVSASVLDTIVTLTASTPHTIRADYDPIWGRMVWNPSTVPADTINLAHAFISGRVRFSNDPWGLARVIIDGRPTEKQTPCEFQVAVGTHTFDLERPGWEVESATVDVEGISVNKVLYVPGQGATVKVPPSPLVKIRFNLKQK
jgi:hypothetical protein